MQVVIILIVAAIGISFVIGSLAGYEPAATSQAEDSIYTTGGTVAVGVDTPPATARSVINLAHDWATREFDEFRDDDGLDVQARKARYEENEVLWDGVWLLTYALLGEQTVWIDEYDDHWTELEDKELDIASDMLLDFIDDYSDHQGGWSQQRWFAEAEALVSDISANPAARNTMPAGGRTSGLPRYQGLGIDRHRADGVRGNPRPGDSAYGSAPMPALLSHSARRKPQGSRWEVRSGDRDMPCTAFGHGYWGQARKGSSSRGAKYA